MKRSLWPTRDSVKDYFPLPKEIFSLGLSAAEIAIYAYLLLCEDRQTTLDHPTNSIRAPAGL